MIHKTSTSRNIRVVGADEHNLRRLERLTKYHDYQFTPLFQRTQLRGDMSLPLPVLLDEAVAQVQAHPPTGVITIWDYPSNEVTRHLSRMLGLPGPTLRSVLGWSHKYWARKIQERVAPETVPEFAVVNPRDTTARGAPPVGLPAWIKPVRATDSTLAFRVDTAEEYRAAIRRLDSEIEASARPLDYLMRLADVPRWFREVSGRSCVVERPLSGVRCTLSGIVNNGRIRTLGVVDSLEESSSSALSAFTYPSRLPRPLIERLADLTVRLLQANPLEESGFNVEFFYDRESDSISVLELNPGFFQSHAPLFEYVDGTSNLELLVDLATGHEPVFRPRTGQWATAGKYFIRRHQRGVVRRRPSPAEVRMIEHEFDCEVEILVREGEIVGPRSTGSPEAPPITHVSLGADSFAELDQRFRSVASRLQFEIDEAPALRSG